MRHVIHHAWSYTCGLPRASGVPEPHIFISGQPAYASYQEPYRRYFKPRSQIAQETGLDPARQWVFLPENYNWVDECSLIRARIDHCRRGVAPRGKCRQARLDLAAIPLDEAVRLLDLPKATHPKIDVDGGEDAVLDGAGETLRTPMLKHVVIEVDSGRPDLGHVERTFAEAGLTRVSVVRHGASATYNWAYQRLHASHQAHAT